MNDKNNNRIKDKIAPALLSSLGLSLTVFVFGAFELYANNMAEFAFGLWDFFGIFIAIALGLTIVLSLALIWLPKRIFDVVCALLSALALMLYVQGTFLTLGMNSIEGDGVGEGAISAAKIAINAVIWVVVIAAGVTLSLIFSKKNSSAVRTAIIFLMVVVLGMQTVSFVTVAATTEGVFDKDNKSIETVDVLTYNELESVGSEKNVIYFVVDRFASSYFEEAVEKYPEMFDSLDGFTYYDDAVSLYPRTYPAMTYMITGVENDFSGSRTEYLKKAWNNSEFLNILNEEGYSIKVYTESYYAYDSSSTDGLPSYIANCSADTKMIVSNPTLLNMNMAKLSFYRYLPFSLRGSLGTLTSKDFLEPIELVNEDFDAYTPDMKAAYDYLDENLLSIKTDKNFAFIHIDGTHLPNKYDKDFNLATDDNKYSIMEGTIQSFKIINLYISQLKQLGLYENATIIIAGDHASIGSDVKDPYYAHLTAMLVKPSGAYTGEIKVSSAPIMQEDIHATILDSEGIDRTLDYGRSIFEIDENETRERRYHFQRVISETGKYELVNYKIVGEASDFDNWQVIVRRKLNKSIYN